MAADQLDVERPHLENALAGFTTNGKRFRQNTVERFTFCKPFFEFGSFRLQSASDNFSNAGSSELILATVLPYCFNSRELRLPKRLVNMDMLRS